jgi:hypothetical protein
MTSDPRKPVVFDSSRRFMLCINVLMGLIAFCPFAMLAAGTGAFLGMSVAVAGGGVAALGLGVALGAGLGVVVLAVILFVVRIKTSKIDPKVYAEKIALFIQDMKDRGIENAVSPSLRLAWMLGLHVSPPLFRGFWNNFFCSFALLGALTLSAGAIYWWEHPNSTLWSMWLTLSVFLLAFIGLGAYSAKANRALAQKFELPSWEGYRPPLD